VKSVTPQFLILVY